MKPITGHRLASHIAFAAFLAALATGYAFYLFPFTVFDGFTTTSNDASSYVLLARKWSPYFAPSPAEILTWPVHVYPPAFPWLLAVTGASESLWAGHLVVSIAMLAGVLMIGWFAYQQVGWFFGALTAVAMALLPGVLTSTMGILSENLYIVAVLGALIAYLHLERRPESWPVFSIVVFLFTLLAVFTRTVGIALVAALLFSVPANKRLQKDTKWALFIAALAVIGAWQAWKIFDPQVQDFGYLRTLGYSLGDENASLADRLEYLSFFLGENVFAMLAAWNHYLSLSNLNQYFFWFSYGLLIVCLSTMGLRAARFKLDAVYLVFYLGIILVWPYPAEMVRFLHPAMMLILIQPALLFLGSSRRATHTSVKIGTALLYLVLAVNSLLIQKSLVELKAKAEEEHPAIVHSLEYYDMPSRIMAVNQANMFQDVMLIMAQSTDIVPPGSTVAYVKPMAYALLTDRPSVILSAVVSHHQQLCNFMMADVDYVLLSELRNAYNMRGLDLVEDYRPVASQIWSLDNHAGEPGVYVMQLDRPTIAKVLEESGFECSEFRSRPQG